MASTSLSFFKIYKEINDRLVDVLLSLDKSSIEKQTTEAVYCHRHLLKTVFIQGTKLKLLPTETILGRQNVPIKMR
jgi:hypothetical protein